MSFTDPAAAAIKMPDGGGRPATNTQFAVETEHRLIVGLDVTGADQPSLEPMAEQIVARTGCRPDTVLINGGLFNRDSVTRLNRARALLLMPLLNMTDTSNREAGGAESGPAGFTGKAGEPATPTNARHAANRASHPRKGTNPAQPTPEGDSSTASKPWPY